MLEEYRHIPMVVMDWGEQKLTSPMRSLITRSKAVTWPALSDRTRSPRNRRYPRPAGSNTGAGRLAGFMKAMEEAMIRCRKAGLYRVILNLNPVIAPAANPVAAASPYCRLLWWRYLAMGALCAADEMGLRVPQDVR